MAASASPPPTLPASSASDPNNDLIRQIRRHEVAIAELNSLSSSRPVYQKNGNLFFRTTVQKATASEQRQLDLAKNKVHMLNTK